MNFSARATYLTLAGIVVLFFIGTGIYYLVGSSKPTSPETFLQVVDKSTQTPGGEEDEEVMGPQAQTDVDLEKPAATVDSNVQDPANGLLANEENDLDQIQTVLDQSETLESNPAEPAAVQCYDTCEYNYECPGTLTCLPANGVRRCVNPLCTDSDTCSCGNALESDDEESASDTLALANTTSGIGGGDGTPVAVPPAPSTQTTNYAPELPKAGGLGLTFLVLVFAATTTGVGLLWLNIRK